jgi:hypothetical protein
MRGFVCDFYRVSEKGASVWLIFSKENFVGAADGAVGTDRLAFTTPGAFRGRFKTDNATHDYQGSLIAYADTEPAAVALGDVD